MGFDVAAEAYDRFMGRCSALIGPRFADFAAVSHGQRALDVGCGPGALTAELVGRLLRTGGSRSRWASAQPAPIWRPWMTEDVPTYGSVVGNSSAMGPSRSPDAPGRRALGPERIGWRAARHWPRRRPSDVWDQPKNGRRLLRELRPVRSTTAAGQPRSRPRNHSLHDPNRYGPLVAGDDAEVPELDRREVRLSSPGKVPF